MPYELHLSIYPLLTHTDDLNNFNFPSNASFTEAFHTEPKHKPLALPNLDGPFMTDSDACSH